MFRVSPPQLEALASQVSSTSTISDISQSRLVTLAAIAGVTRSVCDDERRRAEAATTRLRGLIAGGDARLIRVSCSCRHGQEGTKNCNYGRLCGSLLIECLPGMSGSMFLLGAFLLSRWTPSRSASTR